MEAEALESLGALLVPLWCWLRKSHFACSAPVNYKTLFETLFTEFCAIKLMLLD
jgi:hypothetical protein